MIESYAVFVAATHAAPGLLRPAATMATSFEVTVSAAADAKVVFCDVSSCPTFTTQASDNTHPDATGYATIAAFVEPLYRTILGL